LFGPRETPPNPRDRGRWGKEPQKKSTGESSLALNDDQEI